MGFSDRGSGTVSMSTVNCPICPHACRLKPGDTGKCGARKALVGKIIPTNYGRCTALALDPIEKKPLVRYYPGTRILSYGSFGCNLSCNFCQNWEIAQVGKNHYIENEGEEISSYLSPEDLVEQAEQARSKGNIGIALTYNEPLICPGYILDVAELAHAMDLKLVLVTNGYVMPELAKIVFNEVDACNIDLKAFNDDLYTMVGAPGGLEIVKRTIEIAVELGSHVEVTTLIIPGLNDSPEEMAAEASWLASLNAHIPLHISRYHPAYHMLDTEPTPKETIRELAQVAKEHLLSVHVGNM